MSKKNKNRFTEIDNQWFIGIMSGVIAGFLILSTQSILIAFGQPNNIPLAGAILMGLTWITLYLARK